MGKNNYNSSNYFNPVKVINSKNWLEDLNEKIKLLKIKSPLIVTTKGNNKRLELTKFFSKNHIYTDVSQNPNFNDCRDIITFCKSIMFDSVISIGGGSVMDISKVVIAHACSGLDDIKDILNFKNNFSKDIYSIFIPTNHGTGSEVTKWGTIWDMDHGIKHSISNDSLYPKFAILCPSLMLTLPLKESIITTMDALSHSFESIWNKNSNPVSTRLAIKSICLILENINELKLDPDNLNVRENLLLASNLAGLAFSNTKTASAHSISYPLTIQYGIPHGIASSITLIPLLIINRKEIIMELREILNYLSLDFNGLINNIKSIPEDILPFRLKDWGIPKSDFSSLVRKSFTKGRMENNIIDLEPSDVMKIFQDIE